MKIFYTLGLIILTNSLFAQIIPKNLYQIWVNAKVTFKNGASLDDADPRKYFYVKYTFSRPDNLNISSVNYEHGAASLFEVKDKLLNIKTPEGGLMNTYIIQSTKDTLILLASGRTGFNDPDALKYYLVPERTWQDHLPLRAEDIFAINGRDTLYKQGKKIYASYKGTNFQDDLGQGIRERISMEGRSAHFAASFVVNKGGVADSLRILESIDAEYDKRFIKIFNSTKKNWKPAVLNGNPVAVQMFVELRYLTSATAVPSYILSRKANDAYKAGDYQLALYYYDLALSVLSTDKENLCNRGICKLKLGNKDGACADWNAAKALGSTSVVDNLIQKFCF